MASVVLAVIFGYAAISKIVRPGSWRASLGAYRLGRLEPAAAWVVPSSELIVAGLCLTRFRVAGAGAAVVLICAFSAAIIRTGRRKLPCACFGKGGSQDRWGLLARNILLTALALTVLFSYDSRLGLPTVREVLPALLVGAGVIAGALTIRLTRSPLRR
jgi:hypothetical protein